MAKRYNVGLKTCEGLYWSAFYSEVFFHFFTKSIGVVASWNIMNSSPYFAGTDGYDFILCTGNMPGLSQHHVVRNNYTLYRDRRW